VNIVSRKPHKSGICQRIAQVRRELDGPRGKAKFAKRLGLSPSTYSYYESTRVPPAELLVRIAEVAGLDLRWLLTGEASGPVVRADHPAVQRIAALLADHPQAAGPLVAFTDMLAATLSWPAKPAEDRAQVPGGADPDEPRRDWIPILGRSAAGVPHFWADREDAAGVTMLSDLVERHARQARGAETPAVAAGQPDAQPLPVRIVSLRSPEPGGVSEFLAAGEIKRRYPDAFAVRIDGDSMSPEVRHGDLVVCSPSVPAQDGLPALVQLRRQIGVTCKLFRREGETVHLVPINERYPPQAFPVERLVWAQRVLARVRPGATTTEDQT